MNDAHIGEEAEAEMELTLDCQEGTLVRVLCDDGMSHTFDLQALALPDAAAMRAWLDDPADYGRKLYAALFPPNSLARHRLAEQPDRLLLVPLQDALDAIPWEYAYGSSGGNDQTDDFLVLSLPVVRGLPRARRSAAPDLDEHGLHIIVVPASPLSRATEPLPVEHDWMLLQEVMQAVPRAVTLERCRPPTLKRLRELVANQTGRVVHFLGHGAQEEKGALLCFEQENGDLHEVTTPDLLKRLQRTAFLVTLSACVSATPGPTIWSNAAAALVHQGVPYALGMRLSVPVVDARAFFRTFYSELARGSTVEQALFQARLALAEDSPRRWIVGVPVLYTSLAEPDASLICPPGVSVIEASEPLLNLDALPPADGPFQGRLAELVELGAHLTNPRPPSLLTIHGAGGQGKTALARQAAERFAWAWPGGVWALSLETLLTHAGMVYAMARLLGIETQDRGDVGQVEALIVQRVSQRRTLFVLDNAETLLDALSQEQEIAAEARAALAWLKRLLSKPSVTLLVTSRELLNWPDERYLALPGLPPEDGARLFQQHAAPRSAEVSLAEARRLSQMLDGHPLSLRLLARVFGETVQTMAELLATAEAQLLAAHDKYLGPEHRHYKLYACIEVSVRALTSDLRAVLSALWIFHAPFLAQTAVAIIDPEREETEQSQSTIRTALHQLWSRSLLSSQTVALPEGELRFYALSPTTRPYVETYLEQAHERSVLLARFGQAFLSLVVWISDELDRGAEASVLAHQMSADLDRGWLHVAEKEAGNYLSDWGWILYRLGSTFQGRERLELALERAQEGEKNLLATTLNSLAAVHAGIGQPQRALDWYGQSLPISREVGNRVGEATTLSGLALVYANIGQPQRALEWYEQALPIRREVGDRVGEATTLNGLAEVYRGIGQPQRALELHEQALPIRREVGDRAGEAATLNNLATVYIGIGQPQRALELHEQALSIRREVGDRAGEAATLSGLAGVYHRIGQPQRALELYEQALSIRREVGDRAGEVTTLNNLAVVYTGIGQPQRALELHEQTLPIRREVGDRAGEAATLNNLAAVYVGVGQPQRALELHKQALPIRREVGDRAGEAATLSGLAEVYRGIGQPQRALELYEQALPIFREVGDRAGEAATLNNLAAVYVGIGQPQRALELYEQALPISREVGDRVKEATTLNNLAAIYTRIRQPQRALELYEQALPIRREVGDRAGEAATLYNLAWLYQSEQSYREALTAFANSLQIYQEISQPAGEIAVLVGRALALYQDLAHSAEAILSLEQAQTLFRATSLPYDAAGHTLADVERWLDIMLQGKALKEKQPVSTLPPDVLQTIVENTVAVLSSTPERKLAWEEQVREALTRANAQGENGQQEAELFTALLALLDGNEPRLPAGHPYASVLEAIQQGCAQGGPGSSSISNAPGDE